MKKRILSIILVVLMLTCMISLETLTAFATAPTPDELAAIKSTLTTNLNSTNAVIVQFGTYKSGDKKDQAVEWIVIGDESSGVKAPTGCITLLTKESLGNTTFGSTNVYSGSNLQSTIDNAVAFTKAEKAAIKPRTLSGNGADIAGPTVEDALLWPLAKDELYYNSAAVLAQNLRTTYGHLRTPGSTNEVYYMSTDLAPATWAATGNGYAIAALYLDVSALDGLTAVPGQSGKYTMVIPEPDPATYTTFTLNKKYYNDYAGADPTATYTTAVSETVTYTITPITTGAPAFESNTFNMTVTDGVGSATVTLPTTLTQIGDYWYSIEETAGVTAGVTYDDNTYYLHLVVFAMRSGEKKIVSAVIHTTENGAGASDDKIDTVYNNYGGGKLTVTQKTLLNGQNSNADKFKTKITFTAPEGKTVLGNITYGDKTILPNDWVNGEASVEIELAGAQSMVFSNIPAGTSYKVEQTESHTDMGYSSPKYTVGETTQDEAITGTINAATVGIVIANERSVSIDVGVFLDNSAFIMLGLGALMLGSLFVIFNRKERKYLDEE